MTVIGEDCISEGDRLVLPNTQENVQCSFFQSYTPAIKLYKPVVLSHPCYSAAYHVTELTFFSELILTLYVLVMCYFHIL